MTTAAEDFDAFVRARTPALLRTAYLLTGDRHRAEDLVQDALIRTHRAWLRLRESNPDAYTRKVMYHLNISWWRRGGTAELPTDQVPDRGAPARSDEAISRVALRLALAQLTAKQRAVVVLRYLEDLSEAEAAEMLGVTVGTIKSQTAKALARLRVLAPELLDPEAVAKAVEVSNVDLRDKVLRGSRRITVRNRVVSSVAAVLVLAGAVITMSLVSTGKNVTPPIESPSPSTSSSTSPSPSASASPTATPPSTTGLRNATLDLPAMAGPWAKDCKAGRYTFKDGSAQIPGGDFDMHMETWLDPVEGELDGSPGNEIIIAMNCDDRLTLSETNLLVLKPAPAGSWTSIGYVLPGGVALDQGEGIKVVESQIVAYVLWGCTGTACVPTAMEKQERRYALSGGSFKQVSGPTSFSAMEEDIRKIDFQNFTFRTSFGVDGQQGVGDSGAFRVVNGTGQATFARRKTTGTAPSSVTTNEGWQKYTVTVKQVVYVKTNDWNRDGAAAVLADLTGPQGTRQVVIHFSKHLEGYPSPVSWGYVQVQAGTDGVIGISQLDGGDFVTVTLQTSSGQQLWKYRVEGTGWTRV